MEVDPLYSDWLSVVDDDEFSLLAKLTDDWERLDDSSLRRIEGDKVYVVMREREWVRYQEITRRVEMECESLDASIATDEAQIEMERLLAIESKPAPVASIPVTPAHPPGALNEHGIPYADAEIGKRLFVDPPQSNLPPDWQPNQGASGFVRF